MRPIRFGRSISPIRKQPFWCCLMKAASSIGFIRVGGGRSQETAPRVAGPGSAPCSLAAGKKNRPRRGFGMVQRYMEKEGRPGEKNRTSHWFDVPEGFALECLVIGEGEQRRVYIVTTAPPADGAERCWFQLSCATSLAIVCAALSDGNAGILRQDS